MWVCYSFNGTSQAIRHEKRIIDILTNYVNKMKLLIALFSTSKVIVQPGRLLLIVLGLFVLTINSSQSMISEESQEVFIIGNFGDIQNASSYLEFFRELSEKTNHFTVVLNGDISLTSPQKNFDITSLNNVKAIATIIESSQYGRLIINTGDRDWDSSGPGGWKMVREMERVVSGWNFKKTKWVIDNGCPGPKSISISENLELISIGTQWWNHPYSKPTSAIASCKVIEEKDFLSELQETLDEAENKNRLVIGHYPLLSYGEFGGHYKIGQHFAPPVIGTIINSYKRNIGDHKSINNERFEEIKANLLDLLAFQNSLIYASGHERNLQILQNNEAYFINSGSPVTAGFTPKNRDALYAESQIGMISLVYQTSGQVNFRIYKNNPGSEGILLQKEDTLMQSACDVGTSSKSINQSFIPCRDEVLSNAPMSGKYDHDTLLIAGDYAASRFKKLMIGAHYRTTWAAPVSVTYLDLDKTHGGLTVYEKGGGRQSTSLKIRGGDGKEYVFRSVDKDPTRVLPRELRGTLIAELLQDATSMQHPYGALPVSKLLDHTNILHVNPALFVLPPEDKLGPFKSSYSGLFGMLEEKPTRAKNVDTPFADADDAIQSHRLFSEMYKSHDNYIDADSYARARLFDILIGDWGRHEDNWKWAEYKTDSGSYFRPIPRDRDHAFSRWDGVLMWLADREWAKESGENFGMAINDIRSLTWPARHLDRFVANELNQEDWIEAAKELQSQLTAERITDAMRSLPQETYELSGTEIEQKLQRRIQDLDQYAIKFYKDLARDVDVIGSNKKEYFEVERNADGSVNVQVYAKTKTSPDRKLIYNRIFFPHETREIRLYGLGGKDHYEIYGTTRRSIKIRVIPGPGEDLIDDKSVVNASGKKTLVYSQNEDSTDIGKEGKIVHHWNNLVYNYDRTAFSYNRYTPLLLLGFNSNAGFGVTGGVSFTRKKFGKQDYSAKHQIRTRLTTRNIRIIDYEARFHHVLRKWDILLSGKLADHNDFTYFYGIGNNTVNDDDLFKNKFYLTRYDTYSVSSGLARGFWKRSEFRIGLAFENNEAVRDPTSILGENNPLPNVFGLENINLLETATSLNFDFRDREALPENGSRIFLEYKNGQILEDNLNYGTGRGLLEHFISVNPHKPITLGLRLGGATTFNSQNTPFYKLNYLGQLTGLRGFQKDRFTGRSIVYYNTELRVELAKFKTSFLPLRFGLTGFYDSGRIFSDFDSRSNWHKGYGGGFYIVPYKENFALNVSLAFSEEETGLLLFSLGTGIN